MKKLFTFVAAVLMIIPLSAKTVTFDFNDFANQGTSGTGSAVKAEKEGVTFECDLGYGDGQYGVRCYKNANVKISASENIVSIEFDLATVSGKSYDGGLDAKYCVGGQSWESGKLASQARMNTITVITGEGSCEEAKVEEISVTEALNIAKALSPEKGKSVKTSVKYAVKGFVVGISEKNENTYYLADEKGAYGEFEAYKCSTIDRAVAKDDFVVVTGYITHYYGEGSKGEYHSYEISGGTLVHADGQAVENISVEGAKAMKVMENGQLVIIRNGVKYNAAGAVIE